MPEILAFLLVACGGWFLWDSLKVRELANAAMRAACKERGLLFLDDTVALQSVWPVRSSNGHLTLRRVYDFAAYQWGFGLMLVWGIVSLALLAFTRESFCRPLELRKKADADYADEGRASEPTKSGA